MLTSPYIRTLSIASVLCCAGTVSVAAAEAPQSESFDWNQNPFVLPVALFIGCIVVLAVLSLFAATLLRIAASIVLQVRVHYGTTYKIAMKAGVVALMLAFGFALGYRALGYQSHFSGTLAGFLNWESAALGFVVLILATAFFVKRNLHISAGSGFMVWLVFWFSGAVMCLALFGGAVIAVMGRDFIKGDSRIDLSKVGLEFVRTKEEKAAEEKQSLFKTIMSLKASPTPGLVSAASPDAETTATTSADVQTSDALTSAGVASGTAVMPVPSPLPAPAENVTSVSQPSDLASSNATTHSLASAATHRATPVPRKSKTPVPTATPVVNLGEEAFSSYKAPGPRRTTPTPTPMLTLTPSTGGAAAAKI